MGELTKTTVSIGQSGFKSEVVSGNHHFVADEPISVGGMDLGPSPYDLLASGLGACTVMTLRMYADLKKWDLKGVEVEVVHSKEESEDGKTKIDVFTKYLKFDGDLDEKQRKRLSQIADKCPVHKTLSASAQIVTNLNTSN